MVAGEWRKNLNKARVARKWLSVPETSTPSKCLFTICGLLDTAQRLNLIAVLLKKKVFRQNNINKFHKALTFASRAAPIFTANCAVAFQRNNPPRSTDDDGIKMKRGGKGGVLGGLNAAEPANQRGDKGWGGKSQLIKPISQLYNVVTKPAEAMNLLPRLPIS